MPSKLKKSFVVLRHMYGTPFFVSVSHPIFPYEIVRFSEYVNVLQRTDKTRTDFIIAYKYVCPAEETRINHTIDNNNIVYTHTTS